MYKIHALLDPLTGEIIPFTPALACQVHELQAVRLAAARLEAVQAIRGAGSSHRPLRPAPVDEAAELWRLFQGM